VAPAPQPEPESGPEVAPPPRPVNPSGIKAPDPGPEWQALRPVGELERYALPEPKVGPDPRLSELDVLAEDEDEDREEAETGPDAKVTRITGDKEAR
jgi:hypothetical protein